MHVAVHNNIKSYNLTAGKSLPEWLSERRKRRKSADDDNRIELLHDLEFPHCARCLFRCDNGTHLFAAGDYPYRLKCFDVNELSMKFSFNADMEILSGVSLSHDYRKFALRGQGRQLTIHHSAAIVERLRVPHIQRSLMLNRFTAELLSSGVSNEIFRFNLERGCFVESYKTNSMSGVNCVALCEHGPVSGVVLTAGVDGCVEAWDTRCASHISRLNVKQTHDSSMTNLHSSGVSPVQTSEVRHVTFENSGSMLFACGLDSGEVYVYDIRLQRPLLVKDHMNGLPIVKTYFFQGKSTSTGEASFVLSADTRSLKVWNKNDGSNFTSIDLPGDVSDFVVLRSQHNMVAPYECDDSGVIAICCDVPRVQVHYIPQLGVAPRWASFLETITNNERTSSSTSGMPSQSFNMANLHANEETLESATSNAFSFGSQAPSSYANGYQNESGEGAYAGGATTVYDDYTFIPREEMRSLGLSVNDLAGGRVRPAMHGAFIENSLYRELKSVIDPSAFSRYLAENAQRKKAARWADRISKFKRIDTNNNSINSSDSIIDTFGSVENRNNEAEVSDDERDDCHSPNAANNYDDKEKKVKSVLSSNLAVAQADPRFARAFNAKTGTPAADFALDRNNPEYAKLLMTIEERRAKADARRERYEADLFSIVPNDDDDNINGGVRGNNGNKNRKDLNGINEQRAKLVTDEIHEHLRGVQSSGKVSHKRQPKMKNVEHEKSDESHRNVTMYEVKRENTNVFTRNDKQIHAARKKIRAEQLTLEERLQKLNKSEEHKEQSKQKEQ